MSQEVVMEIIDRATKDEAFRQQLFNNTGKALADYDLTSAEQQMLSNLNAENFSEFAGKLGDRTTKGGWVPGIG